MAKQHGIRVKISLFIPFDKKDLKGLSNAIAASEKLTNKEGLAKLAEMPSVELEESTATQTTRANETD